jgi:hypothetical protein
MQNEAFALREPDDVSKLMRMLKTKKIPAILSLFSLKSLLAWALLSHICLKK